jgi:hypothetical protein
MPLSASHASHNTNTLLSHLLFYLISTFPLRTVAYFNVVGFFAGGGAISDCVPLRASTFFTSPATASCATPAGESATSLISRVVSESLSGAALDCNRIVVGPWNLKKSLSPQILLLAHVLNVNPEFARNCQNPDFLISRKKRVSGKRLVIDGIWNLNVEALKRYGVGRYCVIV